MTSTKTKLYPNVLKAVGRVLLVTAVILLSFSFLFSLSFSIFAILFLCAFQPICEVALQFSHQCLFTDPFFFGTVPRGPLSTTLFSAPIK